jgi:hypothetical protein
MPLVNSRSERRSDEPRAHRRRNEKAESAEVSHELTLRPDSAAAAVAPNIDGGRGTDHRSPRSPPAPDTATTTLETAAKPIAVTSRIEVADGKRRRATSH